MLKKLFSHSVIYGLAPQVAKIANIFALPIITQFLTEDDFGVAGLIGSVTASIAVFANLGLNVTLTNSFYKSPGSYHWGWRQIYGFLTLWNIPFGLLLAIIIYFFIPDLAKENTVFIILTNVVPVIFFGPISVIGSLYFQLRQKPLEVGIRSALTGVLTVAFNILFIAHYKMGYLGWFLAGGISHMLLQLSYWFPMNINYKMTPIYNFKWRYIKNQLKVCLPTVPHYYGSYLLNSSDRIIMDFLKITTGDIGKYNVAGNIANNGNYIGVAVGKAISPMLLKYYREKDENNARLLIFLLQIIFLTGSFIICLWMKEIFQFLIRNETLKMVYPMAIVMTMGYNYRPMYLGAINKLFYNENTTKLMKVTLISGIISLTLNLLLIPIFGFQSAAFVLFIGLMYMGYSGYFLKEYKQSSKINYYPIFWLALTCLLTISVYFLVEFSIYIKILLSLFIIIFVTALIMKINKNQTR